MATKTWTAHDVKMGKLTIHRTQDEFEQPAIHHESRYVFLDEADEVLTQIAGGRVVGVIAIADLPADILDALQKIDTWRKNQALAQEGMS